MRFVRALKSSSIHEILLVVRTRRGPIFADTKISKISMEFFGIVVHLSIRRSRENVTFAINYLSPRWYRRATGETVRARQQSLSLTSVQIDCRGETRLPSARSSRSSNLRRLRKTSHASWYLRTPDIPACAPIVRVAVPIDHRPFKMWNVPPFSRPFYLPANPTFVFHPPIIYIYVIGIVEIRCASIASIEEFEWS